MEGNIVTFLSIGGFEVDGDVAGLDTAAVHLSVCHPLSMSAFFAWISLINLAIIVK